jgi:hypothetical protein
MSHRGRGEDEVRLGEFNILSDSCQAAVSDGY